MCNNNSSHVYTDGSAQPEGKGSGYGVYHGPGNPNNISGRVSGSDSNRAELQGVSAALLQGSRQSAGSGKGQNVTVHTDSQYAINALKGSGKPASPNADLVARGQAASHNIRANGGSVNVVHVKSHSGNPGNQGAHSLAKGAASGRNGGHK